MSGKRAAAAANIREALETLEISLDDLESATPEPANDGADAANLARLLELRNGELVVALSRLDKLERILTAQGGHMSSADQAELRDARDVLEHHGLRKVTRTLWRDR